MDAGEKYRENHKPLHPEEIRSAGSRGYGRAWQKASRQYLATHPLCVKCMSVGRHTKATVVDHIKPHRGDSVLFWNRDNWQALCKRCHDQKTAREDRATTYHY